MSRKTGLKFDEIGYWSEIKLDIVRDYAKEYSKIFSNQPSLYHIYIDAFAGAGLHISKKTGEFVLGSPLNALNVKPSFREYHFIDLDSKKLKNLKDLVGDRSDVYPYEGDCNSILLEKVFPRIRWEDYRRGLCLLDPYGLHLDWRVIETAGKMKSIEIFLNFPVMDMHMNALWNNPDAVSDSGIERMNAFWGDDTWKNIAYTKEKTLFGFEDRKTDISVVADGFRKRLKKIARFDYVPEPLPMRNNNGGIIYYLFFASQNKTGDKIVNHIFHKYRNRGIR